MKKIVLIVYFAAGLFIFGQAAAGEPRPVQEIFDDGIRFLRNQEFEKAIDAFQACLWQLQEGDKHLDSIYDNLGLSYIYADQIDEGIEYLKKSIEVNPDYALPYAHLGAVYRLNQDFDQAIPILLEALKIKPDFAQAHDELWRTYGQLGRDKGYTEELLLREAYHLENLLQIEPKFETGDPGIINELRYLIALQEEIKKTEEQNKNSKALYQGSLAQDGTIANFFAVFDEELQLPEDSISQEDKLKYFAQAEERIQKLVKK